MATTTPSQLILIGVGGAGAAMTRGILRTYGPGIRTLILDTDAQIGGNDGIPFMLLGGNRLAGRGTGGQPASARASFQDNPEVIDHQLNGVRTAIVVTALGGGTGGGATGELLKHLHTLGIVTLLFATMPFEFEGEARMRLAKTSSGPVCQHADVSVLLPLDQLVTDANDNLKSAMERGIDTLTAGVTLLWRILEKPGYIQLDSERLRSILTKCGRAQFACATGSGENRSQEILAQFAEHPLLKRDAAKAPIRTMLVGILAGDDLRLTEIATITSGLTAAFGQHATLELGTVNDEATFSGRLSVVVLLFEKSATPTAPARGGAPAKGGLLQEHPGNLRFRNAEKTIWNNEDLDIPTYLRRQLTLDR